MAIEPEWSAKFEGNSYGFRPGRNCHDAIQAIHDMLRHHGKYVLDADIAGCFDNIDHDVLLDKVNTYPKLRRLISNWLKAGIMDGVRFVPSEIGLKVI
jgi:RNA-directed DNA polymerase